MPKARYRYGADDEASSSTGSCADCGAKDPQERARHHLRLVRHLDLDVLRDHLMEQYVTRRLGSGKERPDVVDDLCKWAANLIEQFSHMVDIDTGAPLQWWEARQYMGTHKDEIAARAYVHAPEKYRQQSGIQEIVIQPRTIREPGEEDAGDWPEEDGRARVEVDPALLREEGP